MTQTPTPPPRPLILSYRSAESPTRVRRMAAVGLALHLALYAVLGVALIALSVALAYNFYQEALAGPAIISPPAWATSFAAPPIFSTSPLYDTMKYALFDTPLLIGFLAALLAILSYLALRHLDGGGVYVQTEGTVAIAPMFPVTVLAATTFFALIVFPPNETPLPSWAWRCMGLAAGAVCTLLCLLEWDLVRFIRWAGKHPGTEITPKPFV